MTLRYTVDGVSYDVKLLKDQYVHYAMRELAGMGVTEVQIIGKGGSILDFSTDDEVAQWANTYKYFSSI